MNAPDAGLFVIVQLFLLLVAYFAGRGDGYEQGLREGRKEEK